MTVRFSGSTLAATGPILVYNAGFERRILRELAEALPDLAPELDTIGARIVDLLPIVRAFYYHPDQQGSWLLKAVLPTMAPDLCYDTLAIGDGARRATPGARSCIRRHLNRAGRNGVKHWPITACWIPGG